MKSFLDPLNLPTITQEQNEVLTADITDIEVKAAISRLKPQKSPGPDGFTAEWYKSFREQLIPKLCQVCNGAFKEGEIPPSWKQAIISVIPKEGKDSLDCRQFRPISVLNLDYKIYMSILARRVERFLPSLINLDQTGFIHGRQTQDSLRMTLHIMWHIQENKIQSMLLGLDAEKVFDSVRWTFLYKVLEKFGFNNILIEAFKAVYNNPTARIKINGSLSNSFILERSCRQGCPCSPLLFALFLEPLSQYIRQNKQIKGINIAGQEHKISLFADDVLIYLLHPSISLPALMSSMDRFGKLSGYKINIQKTQVMTFNFTPPDDLVTKYSLSYNEKSMKYLGINLTQDITKLFEANFVPFNIKLKSDISKWNHLPFLSLTSRIESVKMIILPRLLFLSLPMEISDGQFIEWQKLISQYIWMGKKPRLKFKVMQLPKNKGGMALPNLKDYYWAAQIRTLGYLCDLQYRARWKEIEQGGSGGPPFQAAMADSLTNKNNPWIKTTLNIWRKVVRKYNTKGAENI